jgi:hypothetical protein
VKGVDDLEPTDFSIVNIIPRMSKDVIKSPTQRLGDLLFLLRFLLLLLLLLQVWTQKCAVQKASVDVNISYY